MSGIVRKCSFWRATKERSTCTSVQSDQSHCPHEKTLHLWLFKKCSVKILIRLHECAGWSESLMGAYVWMYIFWHCGSNCSHYQGDWIYIWFFHHFIKGRQLVTSCLSTCKLIWKGIYSKRKRPQWLSWMRRPTGDQEVAGSTPAEVGNILSWRLIMKYFLRSFSPFRWFKKGSCQFLAKECAQYWLTA